MNSPTRLYIIVLAALLLPPTTLAQSKQPNALPAVPRGKLDIRILVTAEPDKVFHPMKGKNGKFAMAEAVAVAPRGKLIAAVVFFKDCQPDAAGNCNVDVDLQGLKPDGSIFENRKAAPLWRVKAPGRIHPARLLLYEIAVRSL